MKTWQKCVIPLIRKAILHTRKVIALSGVFMLANMPIANAVDVNITTEFIADLSQPQKNAFVNTTPMSGFCSQFTELCNPGEFSILIPELVAQKYFDPDSDDLIRNHISLSLDGTIKDITLKDVKTGNEIMGEFRLAFFGMQHSRIDSNSGSLSGVMTGVGRNPSGGCSGRVGVGGRHVYYHGWGVPEQRLTCYKKLNNDIPEDYYLGDVHISNFSFGYTLVTPNPLGVYSGEYEGEVVYTVGEGGDINFHAETTSDSEIRIKIKATVRHAFLMKFPSEGDIKVSLAPRGGWSQWVNGGRVPDSLSQEVPFTLSSTSGFTVNMRCEYDSGTGCALRETTSPQEKKYRWRFLSHYRVIRRKTEQKPEIFC
ncbi:hypothetical protein F3J34_09110 [Klebsiella sp. Ap-873]|nr:hypothetical protein [Klebsiella sp. Ap-873]